MRAYIRAYGVDMSEAAEPLTAFPTFNAFFTRRLRPGARPIDADADVVVSPCDSRRAVHRAAARRTAASSRSRAARYAPGGAARRRGGRARTFARGVHATLYLSPSMYHRVHSPVDGRIRALALRSRAASIPVNGLAVRHVEGLFAVNERVSVLIETQRFGPVAVVLVGAANVGRISLAFTDLVTNRGRGRARGRHERPIPIARGEELGAFNLGSTVVLLIADPRLQPAGITPGHSSTWASPLWRRSRP